tara:strand:+ start:175 stop:396 length:222 start_codon:yes stop_codon:yes gene_type:complete
MKSLVFFFIAFFGVIFINTTANAYIGPGMGLGAIMTILGIIGAIILSIVAIIYYPIKRLIIKIKNKKKIKKDK